MSRGSYGVAPAGPHDAILPALLPANARHLCVADVHLRRLLEASGADITEDQPDVVVGVDGPPTGAAPHVVVLLGPEEEAGGRGRWQDAGTRLWSWGLTRAAVWRTRRAAIPGVRQVFMWDVEQRLEFAGESLDGRRLAERFPRRAAMIVRDHPDEWQSILDHASEHAGLGPERSVLAKEGRLILIGTDLVVRLALTGAAAPLVAEADTVRALRARLPNVLRELLPAPVSTGSSGLATWVSQTRVRGRTATAPMLRPVWQQCVDLMASMHREVGPPVPPDRHRRLGWEVAGRLARSGAVDRETVVLVERVADRAAAVLADVPTVWRHGDFWHGNLLVEDARLRGVVDWAEGGPGQLPLGDMVDLIATDQAGPGPRAYGRGLAKAVVPWARSGGDGQAARLLQPLGTTADHRVLLALVAMTWLQRVDHQLHAYGDRSRRPAWLRTNVTRVVQALTG